jgi:hypothetical protein
MVSGAHFSGFCEAADPCRIEQSKPVFTILPLFFLYHLAYPEKKGGS